jgi:hypothetical protein
VDQGVIAGVMPAGSVVGTVSESGQLTLEHPGMTADQRDGTTLQYKGLRGASSLAVVLDFCSP